jgi:hypothetical protein
MLKLWFADIRYYIRNDFFNGRRPMKKPLHSAGFRYPPAGG